MWLIETWFNRCTRDSCSSFAVIVQCKRENDSAGKSIVGIKLKYKLRKVKFTDRRLKSWFPQSFFVFFFLLHATPIVSRIVRLRPSPRRYRQTIHKLQSTLLLLACFHRYNAVTGRMEIPAGKCRAWEGRSGFSWPDIWKRVGNKTRVAIYHYSLFLSFSHHAPFVSFFRSSPNRPTDLLPVRPTGRVYKLKSGRLFVKRQSRRGASESVTQIDVGQTFRGKKNLRIMQLFRPPIRRSIRGPQPDSVRCGVETWHDPNAARRENGYTRYINNDRPSS